MVLKINKQLILENIADTIRTRAAQGNPMTGEEIHNMASGQKKASATAATTSNLEKAFEKIGNNNNGYLNAKERADFTAKFGK